MRDLYGQPLEPGDIIVYPTFNRTSGKIDMNHAVIDHVNENSSITVIKVIDDNQRYPMVLNTEQLIKIQPAMLGQHEAAETLIDIHLYISNDELVL